MKHPTSRIECPIGDCNANIRPAGLYAHIKSVHEKVRQMCSNCGKTVSYGNMNLHLERCTSDGKRKYSCSINNCKSAFLTNNALRTHILSTHKAPIRCPHPNCDANLKPACLNRHIRTVHNKVKKLCDNCGKQIAYRGFRDHKERCTSDGVKKYPCSIEDCESLFATKLQVRSHVTTVHKSLIKCPILECDKFIKPCSLKSHMKGIHDKPMQPCSNCGLLIKNSYFSEHFEKCTSGGIRKHVCSIENCESSFFTKSQLRMHVSLTHVSTIKCPYKHCDSILKPVSLSAHMKSIHEKKKISCKNCGKSFSSGYFAKHFEKCSSDGVRKFFCSMKNCEASFVLEFHLQAHISQVHKSSIKCPYENCDASMKPYLLKRHMKTVHEKITKSCENCGKFVNCTYLKSHLERCNNDGKATFICGVEDCKASFTIKDNLKLHIRRVHLETQARCPFENCDVYLKPSGLRNHVNILHENARGNCRNCGQQIFRENLRRHLKSEC